MSSPPIKIGMLGGTFDPVHHGHLRSALEVREALGLDRLHMIPAPKTTIAWRASGISRATLGAA